MTRSDTTTFQPLLQRCIKQADATNATWHFPHRDQAWRYQDLILQAGVCGRRLADRDIARGDRVGLALANGPDFIIALLGLWSCGAIAVPLGPNGGRNAGYVDHLKAVDQAVGLHSLIYDQSAPTEAISAWAKASAKPAWESHALTRSQASIQHTPPATVAADDIALLQLTSGSTSAPKAVIVTHGMIRTQIDYLIDSHRVHTGGRPQSLASWAPVHHDAGLFFGVLLPLALACDNLLASPEFYMRRTRGWFQLMEQHRVEVNFTTNSAAVTACRALGRRAGSGSDNRRIDLSRLHLHFGAEKLQVEVLRRLEDSMAGFGLPREQIHIGYGMAENTLCATHSPPGPVRCLSVRIETDGTIEAQQSGSHQATHLASVGRALPGYRIGIRAVDGKALPAGRLGEVWLKGPCISPGYYQDRDTTRQHFKSGWLMTGDLGFLYQGELYFVARQDDLINIGGANIVPDDVEQAVEGAIDEIRPGGSCLIGIRNADGVSVPQLLVEVSAAQLGDANPPWLRRLRTLLAQRCGLWAITIQRVPRGTIRWTSSGKKKRKRVMHELVSGSLQSLSPNASALNKKHPASNDATRALTIGVTLG